MDPGDTLPSAQTSLLRFLVESLTATRLVMVGLFDNVKRCSVQTALLAAAASFASATCGLVDFSVAPCYTDITRIPRYLYDRSVMQRIRNKSK